MTTTNEEQKGGSEKPLREALERHSSEKDGKEEIRTAQKRFAEDEVLALRRILRPSEIHETAFTPTVVTGQAKGGLLPARAPRLESRPERGKGLPVTMGGGMG